MDLTGKKFLQIHDGGLAPGYTAVAVTLTEEAQSHGVETWAANEGFRSLTGDHFEEPRCVHLTMWRKGLGAIPEAADSLGMYRRIGDAGSELRSERYPRFKEPEMQKIAAQYIMDNHYDGVITVGGDGSFQGIKALATLLPPEMPIGFVNVSADSDINGDQSIGLLTCAEEGAKVARGLFEDGFTHKRIYILEMMGNRGGQHALHSGVAARAHLVIMPFFNLPEAFWSETAARLNDLRHGLIVVAEGFMRKHRENLPHKPSASQYVKELLIAAGLNDSRERRVIAEPFSRFIRGLMPLNLERKFAYVKAHLLFEAFRIGKTRVMPYYLGADDLGIRHFSQIHTENAVAPIYLEVIDRLHIPALRAYLKTEFGADS